MTTEERTEESTELSVTGEWMARVVIRDGRMHYPTVLHAFRAAEFYFKSGICLKNDTPQSIAAKLMMGQELQCPDSAAIRGIAVINGTPSLWGDVMLGICQGSEVFDHAGFKEWVENREPDAAGRLADHCTAYCTVQRKGCEPVTQQFSIADAKRAGLYDRNTWKSYPQRMLTMRPRSWALRNAFSDVLQGFGCAEELEDCDMVVNAEVIDTGPALSRAAQLRDQLVDADSVKPEPGRGAGTEESVEPQEPPPDPAAKPEAKEETPPPLEVTRQQELRRKIRAQYNALPVDQKAAALKNVGLQSIDNIILEDNIEQLSQLLDGM